MNNSLKHANATMVNVVTCVDEDTEVAVEVSDNGRGFDVASAEADGGMGLKNMKERVEKLGGGIRITATNQEGTRVLVRLPIGR